MTVEAGDYVVCEFAQSGWAQAAPTGSECAEFNGIADGGHALTLAPGAASADRDFANYQPNVVACTPNGLNDVVEASAPADLRLNRYESDQCMFLFDEQQDVTLTSSLAVDSSRVRSSNSLPKGSVLDSHILHADKIGDSGQAVSFDGTYTFSEPVVGLIWQGTKLNNTDNLLGIPGNGTTSGIDYEASGFFRQFETAADPGGGSDSATVSPDGLTVTFHTSQSTGADEVRILTGTVPEQATISGTKFSDADRDGIADPGETGLSGWTIRAYEDANANDRSTPARRRSQPLTPPTRRATTSSPSKPATTSSARSSVRLGRRRHRREPTAAAPTTALADGGHPVAPAPGDDARRSRLRQLPARCRRTAPPPAATTSSRPTPRPTCGSTATSQINACSCSTSSRTSP